MDNQHSTGIWDIEELPGGHNFSIYQSDTGIHLANVGDSNIGRSTYGVLPSTTILANAHLIAAAPELFETLEGLITAIGNLAQMETTLTRESIQEARTKVLKAKIAGQHAINKALNK